MIRVAYVIDHLRVGGAQRHLLEVVRGLDRDRYALEMWSAAADPGDLASVFEREGVPVRSFGISGTMLSPRTFSAVRRVARDLAAREVQVVHGYLFEGNFLAALTGRFGRRPVTLVSKRSLDRYGRADRRVAAWLSNQLANRVTVNASAVWEVVREHEWCAPGRMVMIPNGVALPASVEPSAARRDADDPRSRQRRLAYGTLVALLLAAGWLLRAAIPPAGLWVRDARITTAIEGNAPGAAITRVDAVTLADGLIAFVAVRAPQGLSQAVIFEWWHGDAVVDRIPAQISGGREAGFRTYSRKLNFGDQPLGRWRVDLRTPQGQLIARLGFEVR